MKVILTQDVESLGKAGDLLTVSAGYARNYLIPKGKALEASAGNMKALEQQKGVMAGQSAKAKERAEAEAERINAMSVAIARKVGEQDKLFGSVTARDIEEALAGQGVKVEKKNILLEDPLKELGEFKVKIKCLQGIFGELTVQVVAQS